MSMLVTSVIPEVADRWDTLAFALHFKVTRVNIIKTNQCGRMLQRNVCSLACHR